MSGSIRRVGGVAAVAAIAATAGLTATALGRTSFAMYDESVYYYQAVLLARGEVPYRDFFCPQPPGLLLIGAASERLGAGLVGVRALNWLCGLVLLTQTYRLVRRLDPAGGRGVELWGAPALVAVTGMFAYQSIQGATNMPAACLEMTACLFVASGGRGRFALAGLALAAAIVLRLQSLIAVPGLLLLGWFAHGRAGFPARSAALLGTLGIAGAVVHLTFAAALPGYVENVVGFHANRLRTDWADRGAQVWQFLQEPVAVLGLPAAAWFVVRGTGLVKGVAAYTLVTTGLITVAGNSLSVMYYLPVLPPSAACVVCGFVRLAGTNPLACAAAGLGVAACGWRVVTTVAALTAPDAAHAACVARLRELPGGVVLTCNGRVAELAGKRGVPDYYATDPNALQLLAPARFHEWFAAALPRADVVLITPELLAWMSPADAAAVRACGRPVVFDTDGSRDAFESICGPVPR